MKKVFIDNTCNSCNICRKICPTEAIFYTFRKKYYVIEEKCIGCKKCIYICPLGSIYLFGSDMLIFINKKQLKKDLINIRNKIKLCYNKNTYIKNIF